MAAISSAIMHFVKAGDHIITINNVYGPANNFMGKYLKKFDIDVSYVAGTSIDDFESALKPNTSIIYLESPASMTYELQDLEKVAKLAKKHNIKTIIDNTWASPINQKPLDYGIDIEIHSVSKYICGHSDVVAGVMIGSKKHIDDIINNEYALLGGKIAPFEAWLILRSLRTLPIRMKLHQKNTKKVIKFLQNHPSVRKVIHPSLHNFPQYELAQKQMKACTGLLSFEIDTEDIKVVKSFVNKLKLFKLGVSWGGHECLVYSPSISYAKELPPEKFKAMGIKVGLVRISIGLEHHSDQIADLKQALEN
jgi:cystathionine beta-lyase/cystathionine gamma-synthase